MKEKKSLQWLKGKLDLINDGCDNFRRKDPCGDNSGITPFDLSYCWNPMNTLIKRKFFRFFQIEDSSDELVGLCLECSEFLTNRDEKVGNSFNNLCFFSGFSFSLGTSSERLYSTQISTPTLISILALRYKPSNHALFCLLFYGSLCPQSWSLQKWSPIKSGVLFSVPITDGSMVTPLCSKANTEIFLFLLISPIYTLMTSYFAKVWKTIKPKP